MFVINPPDLHSHELRTNLKQATVVGSFTIFSDNEQLQLYNMLKEQTHYISLSFHDTLHCCTFLPSLGRWLGSLPWLVQLILTDTENIFIKPFEQFCAGLVYATNLNLIDMSGTNMGSEGALILSNALLKMNVQTLRVDNNQIQTLGVSQLLRCNLCKLSVGNNNIHPDSWDSLLKRAPATLKSLRLAESQLHQGGIRAISRFLLSSSLTRIDVSGNWLDRSNLILFCAGLVQHTTVRRVNLQDCDILDQDTEIVARMLRYNTSITKLNLLLNPIEAPGIAILIFALQENYTIMALHCRPITVPIIELGMPSLTRRLIATPGETMTDHLLRLILVNRKLNLHESFWCPENFHAYKGVTCSIVYILLLCFRRCRIRMPTEIQLLILSYWYGVI